MYYKDDWDKARARFLAFWNRQIVDRCCLAVAAPRKGARPYPSEKPSDGRRHKAPARAVNQTGAHVP